MLFDVKQVFGIPLAGLVLLGFVGGTLRAQPPQGPPGQAGNFRVAPGNQTLPAPTLTATTSTPTYQVGFQPPVLATPYYGTGAYAPYYNPYGGYLSGVADVYSSIGQAMISEQQAGVVREQKKQAQIDTRRKNFDEWLYERDRTPTPEDDRERYRIEQIRRSRNDPPINEIWNGMALNTLMTAILQAQIQRGPGPTIAIDPAILPRLNVTSGATSGSIGLIRDGGKLKWPLALTDEAYDADRKRMDELAVQAYQQAAKGEVEPEVIRGLSDGSKKIDARLTRSVADVTPSDYGRSKTFLREMHNTILALQDPNVSSYITRKWAPKGNSVGEIVNEMSRQGLKFAPAVKGDEAAYVAMYRGLVAYLDWDPSRPWDTLTK